MEQTTRPQSRPKRFHNRPSIAQQQSVTPASNTGGSDNGGNRWRRHRRRDQNQQPNTGDVAVNPNMALGMPAPPATPTTTNTGSEKFRVYRPIVGDFVYPDFRRLMPTSPYAGYYTNPGYFYQPASTSVGVYGDYYYGDPYVRNPYAKYLAYMRSKWIGSVLVRYGQKITSIGRMPPLVFQYQLPKNHVIITPGMSPDERMSGYLAVYVSPRGIIQNFRYL